VATRHRAIDLVAVITAWRTPKRVLAWRVRKCLFVTTVIESGVTQASTLRYCDCEAAPASSITHKAPASKTGKKGTTKKP